MFLLLEMEEILSSLGVTVFERKIDGTGVLKLSKAKYRHLTFCLFPTGRVVISGSLQKYWKGENYSDFTFKELRDCVADICNRFHMPLNAAIQNLEFGVNLSTPFNPFQFCKNVIAYKDGSNLFNEMNDCEPVIGFECKQYEYRVKVYDKGLQSGQSSNILRFEQSVNRMRAIQSTSVKTLADLLDLEKLAALGVILTKTFSDLIISDTVSRSKLSKRDLQTYERGSNPKEWGEMPRWERIRFRKAFKKIIDSYGENKWVDFTTIKVKEKWVQLLTSNLKTANVLTEGVEVKPVAKSANVLTNFSPRQGNAICKRSHSFGKLGKRSTRTIHKRYRNAFKRGIISKGKEDNFRSACRNKGPPKCFIKRARVLPL